MSAQETKVVPVEPTNEQLADRLVELVRAGIDRNWSEYTMRVPVDFRHDFDVVMTEAGKRLRAIAAAPSSDPATDNDELARLEREIAIDAAIEYLHYLPRGDGRWLRIAEVKTGSLLAKALRYLELRGLLEHHPTDPNLVRVKGEGHE